MVTRRGSSEAETYVREVISAPRHRSHDHNALLFQVVTLPPDPTAPPQPSPKLVVYFPFPFKAQGRRHPAGACIPIPAHAASSMSTSQPAAGAHTCSTYTTADLTDADRGAGRKLLKLLKGTPTCSVLPPLVFKKPKLFVVPVTPSAPIEGTDDNFAKPWYFSNSPAV